LPLDCTAHGGVGADNSGPCFACDIGDQLGLAFGAQHRATTGAGEDDDVRSERGKVCHCDGHMVVDHASLGLSCRLGKNIRAA
jgi:hypothetical protein